MTPSGCSDPVRLFRLRRQTPAVARTTFLPLVKDPHVSSSAHPRLRCTGGDRRSDADVTEYMILRAPDRRHALSPAVGNWQPESNGHRITGYFLGGFGRPVFPRQIQSAQGSVRAGWLFQGLPARRRRVQQESCVGFATQNSPGWAQRASGRNPVWRAMRANILGPISSPS